MFSLAKVSANVILIEIDIKINKIESNQAERSEIGQKYGEKRRENKRNDFSCREFLTNLNRNVHLVQVFK